jgi:hypothetical protein
LNEILAELGERIPVSLALEKLIEEAPADHFTLGWLVDTLGKNSFGFIILLLGLLAAVPVGSMLPGFLLAALAPQMIAGCHSPILPQFIANRRLQTRHLKRLGRRATPMVRTLEGVIHPRWLVPLQAMKRMVGGMVFLLTMLVLLTPLPLSNVPPAFVIVLIALGYLEEDGLLLGVALALAVILLVAVTSMAIWGAFLIAGSSH